MDWSKVNFTVPIFPSFHDIYFRCRESGRASTSGYYVQAEFQCDELFLFIAQLAHLFWVAAKHSCCQLAEHWGPMVVGHPQLNPERFKFIRPISKWRKPQTIWSFGILHFAVAPWRHVTSCEMGNEDIPSATINYFFSNFTNNCFCRFRFPEPFTMRLKSRSLHATSPDNGIYPWPW